MLLRRLSVLSAFLLALAGAVALAKPNPLFGQFVAQNVGGHRRAEFGQLKLMNQLNLTQEQKQKLEAIQSQYKGQISQRKRELRQAMQEFKGLMASSASSQEIRTKHQQVEGLRQQVEEVSFESTLAMRDVLTPDQRKQLAQLMEQRRQHFDNKMENRKGPED